MAERRSLRTYEVQVLEVKGTTELWTPHAGNFETRHKAVRKLAAIDVPGTYRIGCFWAPVTLALAKPKLVRTVEPVTKPGHGNRPVVVD